MGLISNKIKRRKLRQGDHIYSYRALHSYSHHGIYTEEKRVIHFTRTQDHEKNNNYNIVGESSNGGGRCGECGYDAALQKGVVKTCLDCFLKGHSLYRFDYNVSSEHLLLKRSGTCSTGPCDEPDVVVRRATEMLESGGGFGDYHVLDNNCEAFAMYCKTGQRVSLQAVSKRAQVKIAYKAFTSEPFSMSNVCEAIGQIAVGHRLDMLAIDKSAHGDQIDEDEECQSANEEDEDEDEDDDDE